MSKEATAFNRQYRKNTTSPARDKVFNWILNRYSQKGRKFSFSDRFVWTGAVYSLPDMIKYIAWILLFLWLAHISFNQYGEARTVVFFIILLIWRVSISNQHLNKISKKLGEEIEI